MIAHGTMTASDAELAIVVIGAGAVGSPAAEAELCRRFGRRVRLYGRSRLRDDSVVDDLVQRVMLVVLAKLRGGEVREPDRIGSRSVVSLSFFHEQSAAEVGEALGMQPGNVRVTRHRPWDLLDDAERERRAGR